MAGPGQHEFDRAAEELRSVEHGVRWRDVILARRQIIDRHFHLRQVEQRVVEHHAAGGKPVFQVAVAQVVGMVRRRHPCCVRIPVQQVERGGRLALQVVADDIGPDQIIRAQHVEGHRHPAAFEHAGSLHVALERRDLVLVDEHQEVAGVGEIDLGRKQCRRSHAHPALFSEPGQRRRKQRAPDAIAGGVDLHLAGDFFDDIHRRQRTFLHVIFEGLLAELPVRVDPGDHEYRDALIDAPFDEGFLRPEVEDVVLVDPGRHDQKRRAQHVLGRRLILDQLHQIVLVDHLAWRGSHVDADHKVGGIGLADAQRAVSGLDVLRQHRHAAHQIVAVRRQRLAQHFRIGEDEIGWRDRVGDLLDVELGLLARVRIDALGVTHQILRPSRRQQIELHHEIEELVRFPLGVLETPVARRGLDCRPHVLAGEPAHG